MTQGPLLSRREEARALRLAQGQPRSAPALQALIETVGERTVASALGDPRVIEYFAGARYRVIGGGLLEEKVAEHGEASRRLAEVGIYNYDRNSLVVAIVDLRAGTVIEIEERTGLQPPATDEEIEEARNLVLDSERYSSLQRQPNLQVVAFPARAAFMDENPLRGHRVFLLTFWSPGDEPTKVGEAAVDLSTRTVLSPEEADPMS